MPLQDILKQLGRDYISKDQPKIKIRINNLLNHDRVAKVHSLPLGGNNETYCEYMTIYQTNLLECAYFIPATMGKISQDNGQADTKVLHKPNQICPR